MPLRKRRRGFSDEEAFAFARTALGPDLAKQVEAASAVIDEAKESAARGQQVDGARVRKSVGVLSAAKIVIDAETRGATWTADRPRLEAVFNLEAFYEEGVALRDIAATEDQRALMEADLVALRDILNSIKAGAPIRDSEGLPSL